MFVRFAAFATLCLSASTLTASDPPKPADSLAEFREATSFAMQADMKSALPHLAAVNPEDLAGERHTTALCMRARFVEKGASSAKESSDPFVTAVLGAYRDYWTRVMLGSLSAADAEGGLAASLSKLAVSGTGKQLDMDALEPLLKKELAQHHYHALFGVTAPLREFMAWRKESDAQYAVDLPEGHQKVHVVFMDDFISLGWLGYATCDYYHSGGWAKTDRLFAVRSAYDLDSESFRVSYLDHEGQHFSDYLRFPGMQQPDLEYRAKLVEIAKADSTLFDLLDSFGTNGSDSREQPHPWANRQVVNDLAGILLKGQAPSVEAWKRLSVAQINAAAVRLLEADSRRRATAKKQS